MPKSAQERLDKWEARYEGLSKPAVVTVAMKAQIKATLTDVFESQVAVETAVKLILAEAATPTILNPFYIGFGKEVAKQVSKFSGGQLINAVDVYLNKWVGRGLDTDILEKVRNTVFALSAPAP